MAKLGEPGGDLVRFGLSQARLCVQKLLERALRDMGDKQVIADAKLRGPLAYLLHIEMAGVRIGFEQSVIGRFGLLAGLRR